MSSFLNIKNKSLISAKQIGFGIDTWSLVFGNQTQIDEIFLKEAKITILIMFSTYLVCKKRDKK